MEGDHTSSHRLVISICGPSGTGKSKTAAAVVGRLGEQHSTRIPTDYYLVPAAGTLDEYFQEPLAYDWALLQQALSLPIGTALETPRFNFESFRRDPSAGSRTFVVRPVCVVDAMYPCPFADITVILQVSAAVRRARIAARDAEWGTDVLGRWEHLELCAAHLDSLGVAYDLCLSGLDSITDNVTSICRLIESRV